jgi:hypothetical protein
MILLDSNPTRHRQYDETVELARENIEARLDDATREATKQERQRRANQLTTPTPSPPDPLAARSIGKIEIVAQLPLR